MPVSIPRKPPSVVLAKAPVYHRLILPERRRALPNVARTATFVVRKTTPIKTIAGLPYPTVVIKQTSVTVSEILNVGVLDMV